MIENRSIYVCNYIFYNFTLFLIDISYFDIITENPILQPKNIKILVSKYEFLKIIST